MCLAIVRCIMLFFAYSIYHSMSTSQTASSVGSDPAHIWPEWISHWARCRLDLGQNYVAVWVIMTWLKCFFFFLYKSGHSRFCIAFPCCWLCFSFRLLFSKTWLDPHWWILLCHSAIITGDNGCCSSPAQTCWINTWIWGRIQWTQLYMWQIEWGP